MGFLQMTAGAIGSFIVALLPYDNAFGLIVVFGSFVALALGSGIFAVGRMTRDAPGGVAPGTEAVLREESA
jgi:hypothetical protein